MRESIRNDSLLDPVQNSFDTIGSPHPSGICAAVVTYNIGVALHRCVDAIRNQVAHVLIIDNGSDEITRLELQKLANLDFISLILNDRNEGLARAYNQAVQWARDRKFEWILTLDHDSEATPGMVDELVRGFQALQRAGVRNVRIVAPTLFDLNIQEYLECPPREDGGLPVYGGEVISSGSLIPLALFDKVGLFNEDLFIYFVDVDFCKRVLRAGFGTYICPEAVLLHQEGFKKRHKFLWVDACYDHYGKKARYYITRNTIYVMKRLRPSRSDLHALVLRLCRDHRNILLFDKNRFEVLWFSLRGLIDGLRGKVGR